MKKVILVIFLANCVVGLSQARKFSTPDYGKIEQEIKKEKSDLYYPKLMKRFNEFDSTLTIEEGRHLYYGYTFQSEYSPYGHSKYQDSLRKIFKKDTLMQLDYQEILKFTDSILKTDPFDIRTINYKLYSYKKLGNKVEYKKNTVKMDLVIDVIVSSGNGISKDSAYYVINVGHEYDLLRIFGYESAGQSLIGNCDYLELRKNDDNIEGLYFDVSPITKLYDQTFKRLNSVFCF